MTDTAISVDLVMCPSCGHQWYGNPGDWFMGHDREMSVWERCPSCDAPLIIQGCAEVTYQYETTIRHEEPTDE